MNFNEQWVTVGFSLLTNFHWGPLTCANYSALCSAAQSVRTGFVQPCIFSFPHFGSLLEIMWLLLGNVLKFSFKGTVHPKNQTLFGCKLQSFRGIGHRGVCVLLSSTSASCLMIHGRCCDQVCLGIIFSLPNETILSYQSAKGRAHLGWLTKIANLKVQQQSSINITWFLERDIAAYNLWCFERYKPSAIRFCYVQQKADTSEANISKSN